MAGTGATTSYATTGMSRKAQRRRVPQKLVNVSKSISYSATVNDTLLEITKDASADESSSGDIKRVRVSNVGNSPAMAIFKFQRWTDEDTIGAVSYLHFLLGTGESVVIPASRAIMTDDADLYEGDILTDQVPSADLEVDSGATLAENVEDSDLEFNVDNGSFFREGDYIQLGINDTTVTRIEVMRITSVTDTAGDGLYTPANLVVERALLGTSAADKDAQTNATSGAVSGAKVYFPIFNQLHDHDKYTLVQTDDQGRFHSTNFFGYGRTATFLSGIMPGSIAIKFYSQGFQRLTGLSDITSGTKHGLVSSTTYYLTVTVDGGSAQEISFTTDSTNNTFGGVNGLVAKIQDALNTAYYTSTSNLFQTKVTCEIEGGDVIFKSGSKLSTSAIALTAGTSGAGASVRFLAQQNGRIPILAGVPSAVASRLDNDKAYDPITYASSYKDIFIKDNGHGDLVYGSQKIGNINYETGEIFWKYGLCPNAQFIISALYNSPLSGKQDATNSTKINSLIAVYGNTPQQKGTTTLRVEGF